MSCASLFSKPSCFSFEYGRLLGSAQTRSLFASVASAAKADTPRAMIRALRKREHIQHASFIGVLRQVFGGVHESKCGRRIASIESATDDRARPAADAREDGDVLLAIRTFIG